MCLGLEVASFFVSGRILSWGVCCKNPGLSRGRGERDLGIWGFGDLGDDEVVARPA